MHGLGGSSSRSGLRRMGLTLQHAGFAVLRLNMRGAGPGRELARGTYAASCNSDLLPALARARELAAGRPLLGMGISLGGTKLLNALLTRPGLLDGLVTISSPLDLAACSAQIERPRNRIYKRWLLQRLVAQTLADPFGVSEAEREALAAAPEAAALRRAEAARLLEQAGFDPWWDGRLEGGENYLQTTEGKIQFQNTALEVAGGVVSAFELMTSAASGLLYEIQNVNATFIQLEVVHFHTIIQVDLLLLGGKRVQNFTLVILELI
jgi:alpha-beta hydrolase superfamily lysophospholipase